VPGPILRMCVTSRMSSLSYGAVLLAMSVVREALGHRLFVFPLPIHKGTLGQRPGRALSFRLSGLQVFKAGYPERFGSFLRPWSCPPKPPGRSCLCAHTLSTGRPSTPAQVGWLTWIHLCGCPGELPGSSRLVLSHVAPSWLQEPPQSLGDQCSNACLTVSQLVSQPSHFPV
jgi:hypothetical protein